MWLQVPFESVDETLVHTCVTIQMKAIEQYFQEVLFIFAILQNEIQSFPSILNLALLGVKGLK